MNIHHDHMYSMYPIRSRYVYVCHIFLHLVDVYVMVNVGDYTIHGSYGYILSDTHVYEGTDFSPGKCIGEIL